MVATLHRPALVDGPLLFEALNTASWKPDNAELRLTDPIGYFEFLSLVKDAAGVLTDSGGIQEGFDGHAARRIVDVFVRAELARAPGSL
jgi:hypothetical protein